MYENIPYMDAMEYKTFGRLIPSAATGGEVSKDSGEEGRDSPLFQGEVMSRHGVSWDSPLQIQRVMF